MQIDARYAPLRSDVKAILRQKTLLGETYVELTPGTKTAETIPENGTIPDGAISEAVQLDEIFRAFDPETREAFQTWMQTQAMAIDGRGAGRQRRAGQPRPVRRGGRRTSSRILRRQQPAVQSLVSQHGRGVRLAEPSAGPAAVADLEPRHASSRRPRARDASSSRSSRSCRPSSARRARRWPTSTSFARQHATRWSPSCARPRASCRRRCVDLKRARARPEGAVPGDRPADHRVQDRLPGHVASCSTTPSRCCRQFHPFADELLPILRFIKPYKRELTAFFANVVAATQATTAVGDRRVHYLRTTNPLNPEVLAAYPRRIGSNRAERLRAAGPVRQAQVGSTVPVFENRQCGRGAPVISAVHRRRCWTPCCPADLIDEPQRVRAAGHLRRPDARAGLRPAGASSPSRARRAQYPRVEARSSPRAERGQPRTASAQRRQRATSDWCRSGAKL